MSSKFYKNLYFFLPGLFGVSLAFVVFVLFLQTTTISTIRLLIIGLIGCAGWAFGLFLFNKEETQLNDFYEHSKRTLFPILLPLLFLPSFFAPTAFPLSPILRGQTDIALEFKSKSDNFTMRSEDVRLVIGENVFDLRNFHNQTGQEIGSAFSVPSGGKMFFQWQGPVDSVVTLNINIPPVNGQLTVYWDRVRTIYTLSQNAATEIVLKQKYEPSLTLQGLFFLGQYLIFVFVLFSLLPFVEKSLLKLELANWSSALIIFAAAVGIFVFYVQSRSIIGGLYGLNGEQLSRHMDVLNGTAPNPWQYRVLSEWLAEGLIRINSFFLPKDSAVVVGFLSLRTIQNVFIFWLAFLLYKRLTKSHLLALLGILLLGSACINATFESALSFDTYFDVLFYLLAVLFILDKKYIYIIFLMLPAALNRETSGLIPFLLLSVMLGDVNLPLWKRLRPAGLGLLVWAGVFLALRFIYPNNPLYIPYQHAPGYPLLVFNLHRPETWQQLFYTLGFIPFIGVFVFQQWHPYWKRFFFVMIPIWFIIHLFASAMAETRLFLVPDALVFIPGVLFLFMALANSDSLHWETQWNP